MDFHDSPGEAAFRSEISAWLDQNAADFTVTPDLTERQAHDLGRAWQRRKADAGYVGFALPVTFGGRGGSILEQLIFQSEEALRPIPKFNSFVESWGVVLPVLAAFGTQPQFERFGPPTLRGDMVWCQLFSEPAGGSDLAALRTRAERDGDGWVINGQKVWTSDAHLSDWGILLARTNWDVPKHKGLTMFLVDMRTPGVETRPIRKINGDCEFNEVFFTDVRLSDDLRIGPIDGGWGVAHKTFSAEHAAFSGADSVVLDLFGPLVRLARELTGPDGRPRIEDPRVRAVLADYYVAHSAVTHTRYRQNTGLAKGGHLGFESTISKLVLGRLMQATGAYAIDLVGPAGLVEVGPSSHALRELQDALFVGPGLRIGGGTDEVALNNIAERVLGLPAEVRPDRDTPFRDLPT